MDAHERTVSGLSPEEAKLAARRDLGNTTLLHEEIRTQWSWTTLEQLGQDLRYAFRMMSANRVFTALAVLSLALGIGANTAIYGFVESILLRSLPVPDPQALVAMKWRAKQFASVARSLSLTEGEIHPDPRGGMLGAVFPYPVIELVSDSRLFTSVFAYTGAGRLTVMAGNQTEAAPSQYVSGDYFRGMGIAPAAGRLLVSDDDRAGAAPVVVLSYRCAQRAFGDPARAVGQSIRINLAAFEIAGVVPPDFFGADPAGAPDIFLPFHANLLLERAAASKQAAAKYLDANNYWIEIMARLKPGVTLEQAQAALEPRFGQFVSESAANDRERSDLPGLNIVEGAAGLESLRIRYSKPLYILMAMVGAILLIACANVANLLLARAAARRREMAVRLSLGASRARVVRQLLTESVLLASIGGALGVAFAFWGIRFISVLLATGRPDLPLRAALNGQVLAAALLLSVTTGLVFGLAPALQATRVDMTPALKDSEGGGLPRRIRFGLVRVGLSGILVSAQLAFSLLLLVGAGLFGRGLANLHSIPIGFNRDNILLFTIKPGAVGYSGTALAGLYGSLRETLSRLPGVRAASFSDAALPAGNGTKGPVSMPGAPQPVKAWMLRVGPSFLSTMQIPLAAGRDFEERDGAGPSQVAVVNRSFVKSLGMENPLGRTVVLGNTPYQIVGVAGDAVFLNLKDSLEPVIYLPSLGPRPPAQTTFAIRAAGNPVDQARAVQEILRRTDSRLALVDLKTEAAHIDQAISEEITLARLCTLFAAVALLIACVGLYGTVSYNVARRTPEIGIRMALGARRWAVLRLVLAEVFRMALLGLAAGIPAAFVLSRFTESLLFGVKPHDARSAIGAVVLLLCAASVAAIAPAQRASRIDPTKALRHE
jgi:predicted permease